MSESIVSLLANGERYLPECMSGGIEIEHQHRYYAVCELVTGLDVLDIASGEGYGSALLARSAKSVVGVDICEDAVNYSNTKYRANNLCYKQGSCASIPLPDASVDAVISFETIEHHTQHEEMMAEVKRVLRPNGFLVISSPDKDEYNKGKQEPNSFHVKELFRDEFEALLNKWFKSSQLYGQRAYYGSNIASIDSAHESNNPTINFSKPHGNMSYVRSAPPPVYFIAVASDNTVPKLPLGLLYGDEQEIYKMWDEIVILRDERIMLNQEISRLNRTLSNRIICFIALLFNGNIKKAITKLKAQFTRAVSASN